MSADYRPRSPARPPRTRWPLGLIGAACAAVVLLGVVGWVAVDLNTAPPKKQIRQTIQLEDTR